MGVNVGVGVSVLVGEGVLLGVTVRVIVALGVTVAVGVGPENNGELHPASHPTSTNKQVKVRILRLRRDIKERVMIVDLVVVNTKGIIPIADISLGRAGRPREMTRTARPAICAQAELAIREHIVKQLRVPGT